MVKSKKCCVSGCTSTNEDSRLFNIPRNDALRALWLSFLIATYPLLSGLNKEQLIQKVVCQHHFHRHQYYCRGNRLQHGYPSLFTEEEIRHGIPLLSRVVDHPEHNYCSRELPSHRSEHEDCGMIVIDEKTFEILQNLQTSEQDHESDSSSCTIFNNLFDSVNGSKSTAKKEN